MPLRQLISLFAVLMLATLAAPAAADPPVTAEMVFWVDATDINGNGTAPADGDAVTLWKDKAGTAQDLGASSGTEPYYTTTTYQGQSLPGVRFRLDKKLMAANPFPTPTASAFTVFYVSEIAEKAARYDLTLSLNGSSNSVPVGFMSPGGNDLSYFLTDSWDYDFWFTDPSGFARNSVRIYSAFLNGTAKRHQIQAGASFKQATGVAATVSGGIGMGSPVSGTIGIATDVRTDDSIFHEVIIYDRTLTAGEILSVECYLFAKWQSAAMPGSCTADKSDAPASYAPASHTVVSGIRMGGANDADTNDPSGAGATGDDTTGVDDEDGVSLPSIQRGSIAAIPVSVTGTGGYLQGWIDWNGDGDFADSGEQIAANLQDGGVKDFDGAVNGQIQVKAAVPASAATSQSYARFRWSTTSGLGASGAAADGEVEDHALTILAEGTAPALRGCGAASLSSYGFTADPTAGTITTGAATGQFAATSSAAGMGALTAALGTSGIEYRYLDGTSNAAPDSYTLGFTATPDANVAIQRVTICQSPYFSSAKNEIGTLTLAWDGGLSAAVRDPDNQITSHANGAIITSGTVLTFAGAVDNGTLPSGLGLPGPDTWAIIIDVPNQASALTVSATGRGCELSQATNFCHLGITPSDTTGNLASEWLGFDVELVTIGGALDAAKSTWLLSDPVNGTTNPKAIPGATARYCILLTNNGPAPTTNLIVTDSLPALVTYIPGSMKTGANCAGTAQVEDDDNAGPDETDPTGAAISGGVITITHPALAVASAVALTFDAIIQ